MDRSDLNRRRLLKGAVSLATLTPLAARAQTSTFNSGPAPIPTPPPVRLPPSAPPTFRSDQIGLLMQVLQDAPTHGFKHDEFLPPNLDSLLRSSSAAERMQGAAMLKAQIIAYARAQHGLRIAVSQFPKNWGMRPVPYDGESEFNYALQQDNLSKWLQGLPPPFDRYRGLQGSLVQYRKIVADGGWDVLEDGPALALGSRGARVAALRARLAVEDPEGDFDDQGEVFNEEVQTQLRTFQHNVGFEPSGVLDKATLAALNVPAANRVAQIEANMERWRWVPRIWPATRIEANIAAQEMSAFQDNALVLEMRAAPGRPDDQTPMLASQVQSVVFDPPWNVPSSIATKELWPKEHAHPGYLASHGYKLISTGDGGQRIQQSYGPKSALGSIKFDFPNDYAVYLHDTPSRRAFSNTSRAVSHGCVRLQRPKELANLLFKDNETWTADHIDETIANGKTVWARLDTPVPIFLMYWTAFLDVKGRTNFRPDVYGWDEQLMGLIAATRNKGWPSAV